MNVMTAHQLRPRRQQRWWRRRPFNRFLKRLISLPGNYMRQQTSQQSHTPHRTKCLFIYWTIFYISTVIDRALVAIHDFYLIKCTVTIQDIMMLIDDGQNWNLIRLKLYIYVRQNQSAPLPLVLRMNVIRE